MSWNTHLVNDPIEYGVGEGRLADDIVPGVDGQFLWLPPMVQELSSLLRM